MFTSPQNHQEHTLQRNQVLIFAVDREGIITDVDQEYLNVSEFKRVEVIGEHYTKFYHPEMSASWLERAWQRISAGHLWQGIVKLVRKGGEGYWANINVAPALESDGYLFVCTCADPEDISLARKMHNAGNAEGDGKKHGNSLWLQLNPLVHMKIWQKIVATLLLLATLMSASWWISLRGLEVANNGLVMSANDREVSLAAVDISHAILSMMADLRDMRDQADSMVHQQGHRVMADTLNQLDDDITLIRKADLSPEEEKAARAFLLAAADYISNSLKPLDARLQSAGTVITPAMFRLHNDQFKMMEKMGEVFRQIQLQSSKAEADTATRSYHAIRQQSMSFVALSLFLAFVFSLLLIRNFNRRLNYTTDKLNSIAKGHCCPVKHG